MIGEHKAQHRHHRSPKLTGLEKFTAGHGVADVGLSSDEQQGVTNEDSEAWARISVARAAPLICFMEMIKKSGPHRTSAEERREGGE